MIFIVGKIIPILILKGRKKMGYSTESSVHGTGMDNLAADRNLYLCRPTSSTYSQHLVVVFGHRDFVKIGISGSSFEDSSNSNILGKFDDLNTDILFVKPNNPFDYYRSAGKTEAGADYYGCTTADGNLGDAIQALITRTSGSYSSVRFLGIGLSGSFGALWYATNSTDITTTVNRCVVTEMFASVAQNPTNDQNNDNIGNITSLPGYNNSNFNTVTSDQIASNTDTTYYLPTLTKLSPAAQSGGTQSGTQDVYERSSQDMSGWPTGRDHVNGVDDIFDNYMDRTFGGIGARSE